MLNEKTIVLKNNKTLGVEPQLSDLVDGELGINVADGVAFLRQDDGAHPARIITLVNKEYVDNGNSDLSDRIDINETNITNNTTDITNLQGDSHTHSNKTILDGIIDTGSGTKYLSDNGTYKTVTGGGGGSVESIIGTVDEIIVDSTDPANPVISIDPAFAGGDGTSTIIRGSAPIVDILEKGPSWDDTETGDVWIATDTRPTGVPVPGVIGDGYTWDGTQWINVGQVRGPAGPAGSDGVDGINGNDGAPGTNGSDGAKGDDGDQGLPGADGNDGTPGTNGTDGDDGDDGAQGDPGADGSDGAQGVPGTNGNDGAKGDDGDQGIQGTPGVKGDDGIQGIQGIQGVKGDDGSDGAQGIPGTNGTDGDDGAPGADGADGAVGPEGPTAVSTDAGNIAVLGSDTKIFVPAASGFLKSDPTGIAGATIITNIVQIGQAAYDNLGSYDTGTVYIINGA